ncbi:MAG: iron chelate uptake ABC transporter family permease subunit, partial [Myxococcales bacterium]|nr:iron chelate uptake ABC transporter family permease subunit [Myxococcales bacterium]
GFVGLMVPHILRLAVGPHHRRLLPASMAGGALFLLLADLLTRTVGHGLRLGVVTALAGGPFFLFLLLRHRRRGGLL